MTMYLVAACDTHEMCDVDKGVRNALHESVTNAAKKHVPGLANENLPFECAASAHVTMKLGQWEDGSHFDAWFDRHAVYGVNHPTYEWYEMENLRDDCKRVLENTDLAGEVLPTEAENERAYLAELQHMVDVIDKFEELFVKTNANGEQVSVYDFEYIPDLEYNLFTEQAE